MNCARKGDAFGASLERSQWLAWKLRHFEASLPPSVFLSEPQFYEEPELIFVHDSDSECSLVFDEVLGDEVDASDSDEETLTCRLWDINFGWTPVRNVKAITPIAWNQTIGDQLFLELEGGGNQGQVQVPAQPPAVPAGVHVEPAAPDVNRPRLPPAAGSARPVEDDVVEYPDGAPGDLVREMKESDPTYRAPLPRKRAAEPAPPPRKPGELKIARQEPLRAPTPKSPAMVSVPSA
eukprot:s6756_g1.t1